MVTNSFRSVGVAVLVAVAIWPSVALNRACAEDKDQEIRELRSRLEKLERLVSQQGGSAPLSPAGAAEPKNLQPTPASGAAKAPETAKGADGQAKPDGETEKKDGGWKVIGENLGMKAKWDYGVWLATEDEAFRIHFSGRAQFDGVWAQTTDRVQFGKGGIGKFDDGVNFRRLRLGADGWMYEVFDFNCQVDFVQTVNDDPTLPANAATNVINPVSPTDVWASINYIPWIGTVRMGNQKPPMLLEHLTSSRFLDFLERSPLFDAYFNRNNGYQPGVLILNWSEDERLTWEVGGFKNNNTLFGWNVGDGEYQVNGRLTWLPWYQDEGRCMIHLGIGLQYDEPDNETAILRERWLLRNGPPTVQNTVAFAAINGHRQFMAAPEFFMNLGPLSMQADYLANHLSEVKSFQTQSQGLVAVQGNPRTYFSQGAYIQVMYFLTGEHRPYNRTGLHSGEGAGPARVVPLRNFFWVRGEQGRLFSSGAWQVGVRYAYSDLSNHGIYGGQVNEVTLGLNWFLNGNMKIQWNYDVGYRGQLGPGSNSNGTFQGVGTRLAFDW
jgi:phosphate-selective porin OprO/OprP